MGGKKKIPKYIVSASFLFFIPLFAFASPVPSAYTNGGTNSTFAFTSLGSGCEVFVGVTGGYQNDNVTAVSYDGSSALQVDKAQRPLSRYSYLYAVASPAAGAFNVVISSTDGDIASTGAWEYCGVNTVAGVSGATHTSGTGNPTLSFTIATAGSWTVAWGAGGNAISAGSGSYERGATDVYDKAFDSNADLATGAYSMDFTVNDTYGFVGGIIVPATGGGGGGGAAPDWIPHYFGSDSATGTRQTICVAQDASTTICNTYNDGPTFWEWLLGESVIILLLGLMAWGRLFGGYSSERHGY